MTSPVGRWWLAAPTVMAGLACATGPRAPAPPRLTVSVDDVGPAGVSCGVRVEPVRGPRPVATRVVAVVEVEADRPVPLETLEQAARVPALRRCASGLSVLRAEAADGLDGYLSLRAEAWDVDDAPTTDPRP